MTFVQLLVGQILNGLLTGSSYVLMALGFSLMWGILGVFNFSHGAFYMLGSYIIFYCTQSLGINPYAALIITMVIMFLVGVVVERVLIRPLSRYKEEVRLVSTAVVTIALAVLLQTVVLVLFGGQHKTLPSFIPGIVVLGFYSVSNQMTGSFVIAIILVILVTLYLRYSKMGLGMNALSQNPIGASLAGVNPNVIFPVTFGISAALASAAGALLAPVYALYPNMGWTAFMYSFVVVVMGGLGSVVGIIAAGLLLGMIKSIFTIWISPEWVLAIVFGFLISIILVKPTGLFGVRE